MNQSSPDVAPNSQVVDTPDGATPAPTVVPAIQPVLEKLFELYPHLFGAKFLPLKLGVFHDLMAAHPEVFDKATLKLALGRHTRSTAYLQCVAACHQRYDLAGQAVGDIAPEHILMALLELFTRRQRRAKTDLRPQLHQQIAAAFRASGLSATRYRTLTPTLTPDIALLMDEVLEQALQKEAKEAALLRAYEASGTSVNEFAAMYGLEPSEVLAALKTSLSACKPATP